MFKLSMCILCVSSQVANCAPSGPREDGAVQGLGADPSAARLPRHRHKAVASSSPSASSSSSSSSLLLSPSASGFQRTYRWSTACSVKQQTAVTGGGDLLRFLPGSLVDARGVATDPDSKFFVVFSIQKQTHIFIFNVCLLTVFRQFFSPPTNFVSTFPTKTSRKRITIFFTLDAVSTM